MKNPPEGYRLVFEDNFDSVNVSDWGPISVNGSPGSKWIAHTPYGGDFGDAWFGMTNGPVYSIFTETHPTRHWLMITATKDLSRNHWYSGLIASIDNQGAGFSQAAPAYWECSLKPLWTNSTDGKGMWPSFWLDGVDRAHDFAEIDVYEAWGAHPATAHHTWHKWQGNTGAGIGGGDHTVTVDPHRHHVYGCLIQPDFIHFSIDGIETWKIPSYPAALLPLYAMVNLAMINAGSRTAQAKMRVDYVRCYAP